MNALTSTVNKERLLNTLRTNRDEHRSLFEQAQEKYREAVIAELDSRLQQARDGKKPSLNFNLPEPVDYTDHYDMAIEMVEWNENDLIELTQRDFQQFVLNRWEWAQGWPWYLPP